jgi:hypothetical protein
MLISIEEHVKISWIQVRIVWGMLQYCHVGLCKEMIDKSLPVCWSSVVNEKPTVGSWLFGALASDRISKATKDVSVNYSFTVAIRKNFTSELQELRRIYFPLALEASATEGFQFPEFLYLIYTRVTGPEIFRTEGLSLSRTSQMHTKRKYLCLPSG